MAERKSAENKQQDQEAQELQQANMAGEPMGTVVVDSPEPTDPRNPQRATAPRPEEGVWAKTDVSEVVRQERQGTHESIMNDTREAAESLRSAGPTFMVSDAVIKASEAARAALLARETQLDHVDPEIGFVAIVGGIPVDHDGVPLSQEKLAKLRGK